ncbi:hypothetical protein [Desulforamulus aquiferis]|uniref:DUF4388 domain-containing protein n=1 Tax=Desulforamulus aquiferis TaxID=1397668 RepID=A0AAW7ZAX9_9FIRM|nr:hypothetical protein [Desulforamulus aquiferis]MDO7786384.1 hypothetical protein [Desulforamulus aquiferis]
MSILRDISAASGKQIFVFDGKGRLSVNKLKLSTALNAVNKGRASWVGTEAIQHKEAFEDSKITFDFKRHFREDNIVLYDTEILTGVDAFKTMALLEEHNKTKKNKLQPRDNLTMFARFAAKTLVKTDFRKTRLNYLDEIDRAILGVIYVLSGHPCIQLTGRSIANICSSLEYPLRVRDIDFPPSKKRLKPHDPIQVEVALADGKLTIVKGKSKVVWKFRLLKGINVVSSLKDKDIDRVICRIVSRCDDLIFTKLEELQRRGLVRKEYGEFVLTDTVNKLVKELISRSTSRVVEIQAKRKSSGKEKRPGCNPSFQNQKTINSK